MRRMLLSLAVLALTAPSLALADAEADRAAIQQAALDYAEGWYEGNAERMERALHPDLAKRIARNTAEGRARLDHMSAMALVQATRRGSGKNTPKERQQKDVTILHMFGNAATVKLEMHGWIDYLHVARVGDRWVIVNVLWELKPQPVAQ
ncbi:MAG: nuclear transport factor 2 family protein [Acidobacteria bacterium]|nr:nuclear transport factor 2 family protein [Acidobacteriota bacterium]